jgi:ParB family chromosome partitioning protein
MGHGRAMISIEDQDQQAEVYQKIVTENLSVRDTEALVKNILEGVKTNPSKKGKTVSLKIEESQQNAIASFFGAKVAVSVARNGKGKIMIPFHSEEDFKRILKLIQE